MADPIAYPLAWPPGWPRTNPRQAGSYRTQLAGALTNLRSEIRLLSGQASAASLVLSSNVTLGAEKPSDPGVVAYFQFEGDQVAIPCDRWQLVAHNVQAIALTIESMRAMERHGAKQMIKAMFRGFLALPSPGKQPWRAVLGFRPDEHVTKAMVQAKRREMARLHHADAGGTGSRMAEINAAADDALREAADA